VKQPPWIVLVAAGRSLASFISDPIAAYTVCTSAMILPAAMAFIRLDATLQVNRFAQVLSQIDHFVGKFSP
jgi:hypothetical protein